MFFHCFEDFRRSYPKDYDIFSPFVSNHTRKHWFTLIETWRGFKFTHSRGSTKCRWQSRSKDEKENLKGEMATTTTKIMLNRRAPFCPSGWEIIQEPHALCSSSRWGAVFTPQAKTSEIAVWPMQASAPGVMNVRAKITLISIIQPSGVKSKASAMSPPPWLKSLPVSLN